MSSEAELLNKSPLLINKIVAERLSDKIQVVMVPSDGKFFFASDVFKSAATNPIYGRRWTRSRMQRLRRDTEKKLQPPGPDKMTRQKRPVWATVQCQLDCERGDIIRPTRKARKL